MNQRNNFKNNNNNIDDEIDSFNEEDEDNNLFINKKELVHIENDTSINVDKSFDEEHSKTSTLKKGGLLINNISAINVQFSQGIDLSDKKMADPNFFTRQLNNDFGDFNDTTDNKGDNALNNYRANKNKNDLKITPSNYFETFNTMAASTEENNFNINNNIQNNLNNLIIGSKRNKKMDNYSITNFNHNYIGIGPMNLNKNGGDDIPLREFQNKYNQLESKYFNLNEQYKKMKLEIDELNNSNKSLLELLSYWQKFYLEVKEIVLPEEKKNRNEISLNDCMDDPYRIQVIDEVKKLIIISRDKVYKNFYKNTVINFAIFNNNKIKPKSNYKNNLIQKRIESFVINKLRIKNDIIGNNLINDLKKSKKFMDESDDLDHLPPIKYKEKINIGVNTDENQYNNKKNYFDPNDLSISQKVNKTTFFEIKRINNKSIIKQDNPRIKKLISSSSNKNIDFKNKLIDLQIINLDNIFYKGKPTLSPLPRKFKKNTTYKFAFIQTDITNNNITELLSFKNEKEKIIKQYEEKINTLNNYIKNNINNKKNINNNINEKNILSSRIINNNKKINNYIHIKNNKENNSPNKNQNANNGKKIFLPEMIPPENTYKIFMNCIKNFKYEEGIYQKYMIEDDLQVLKNFVEKMEKYFVNTSLPVLKAKKRRDYIIHTKANNESSAQKKYKERILSGNKTIFFNINSKRRNISDLKNTYERSNSVLNNNIIFNKYKAAIMSLKDE